MQTHLSRRLCGAYFPGIVDPQLETSMDQLLASMQTERRVYADGPLRQALCICYLSPVFKSATEAWRGSRAIVSVQLANGLLFGLHLKGHVRHALDRLEQIGHWLALRPYAVDAFDHYDAGLSDLVNAGQPVDEHCDIRLARFASVAPLPGISREMLLSMAFGAFNLLRKQYGLRPLNRIPRLLAQHVVSHITAATQTIASYLASLDQNALGVIRRFDAAYHHRYDDLRVYNFFVAEHGKFCRNRVQAVLELPWLLRILSGMHHMHSFDDAAPSPARVTAPRVVDDILRAIDSGKPLFASVARACGVPQETVRRTRHQMLPNVGQFAVTRVELLLKMLSWLPPEKRPRSNEDWRAMREIVCSLLPILSACSSTAEFSEALLAEPRYATVMARWMRELMRPDLASAQRRILRLRHAGHDPADAKDYMGSLLRALPRYRGTGRGRIDGAADPHQDALLDWLAAQPLHLILARSRCWHERMREHALRLTPGTTTDPAPMITWPAILPEPLRMGQVTIIELVDAVSLHQESMVMKHCVGGYADACTAGDSVIVSLRHDDGRHLSTAELALDADSLRLSVRQHKGRENVPASKKCEQLLTEFVTVINGSAYLDNRKARRDFQAERRYARDTVPRQRAAALDGFRQMEEQVAWTCTFGSAVDALLLPPPSATGRDGIQQVTGSNCDRLAILA